MLRTLFSVIAVVLVGAMAVLLYTNNVGQVKTTVDNAVTAAGTPPPQPEPVLPIQPVQPAPQPVVQPLPVVETQPAPVTPLPVAEKKAEPIRRTHVVQAGDTLSGISRKYYNTPDYYSKIASFNGLKAKDHIRVRQVLLLPDLPVMADKEVMDQEHVETVNAGSQDFEPQPPTLNITVPRTK
jgi:LysM repeat protein